ncbi:hypothetical protein ACFE33_00565 [Falsihalocynthiibacter sp. SS001]|uniref:hypothetical protein n=1 Tax=Falsihalocynthiibacter sp. SS001 TaxID=3349698 RepID=UPI0036D2856D
MVKPPEKSMFKAYKAKPETILDKTTRVVRKMVDEEAEIRQAKITRLRKARLEREASTAPASETRKPRKTKPTPMR